MCYSRLCAVGLERRAGAGERSRAGLGVGVGGRGGRAQVARSRASLPCSWCSGRPCPAALTSSRPRLPECHSIPASLTVCLAHQDVSSGGTGMLVPCHRGTLGTFDLAWCQQTLTNQSGMRKCTRSS